MTTNNIYRNFTIQQIATTVQGDKAVVEICQALQEADTYDAEAIVLIRGGGSKMDLNVFNDYQICSVIAGLGLPVITGIGHETDEVVADLVAHTRQITPTAVAKFLYVRVGTFRSDLQTGLDRVLTQALSQMARATEQFTNTNKFLSHYFQHIITEYRTDLQSKLHHIQLFTADILAEERSMLELALNRGGTASVNYIKVLHEIELPSTLDRILVNAQNLIDISRLEMIGLRDKMEVLNPMKLLKVGYTISSIDQTDLTHYSGAYIGKELQTLTDQFTIYSTITKIEK
jgi:exodeoxyribonuclease VII large subunit